MARIAAYESWGKTADRSARTAAARAALDKKFLDQAAGDPVRAEALRKAHFLRLARKSAQSRLKAKALLLDARSADAEIAGGDAA